MHEEHRSRPIAEPPHASAGEVRHGERLLERSELQRSQIRTEALESGGQQEVIDVTVAKADVINRNRNLYPRRTWEAAIGCCSSGYPSRQALGAA